MPPSSDAFLRRRIRLFHFNAWARQLEDSNHFAEKLPDLDLTPFVSDPNDANLMRMARLDCDWHSAITQVLAVANHPDLDFMPARDLGAPGMLDLARAARPVDEEWWLVFEGQSPQKLAGSLSKLLPFLSKKGVRILYYSFDEASRTMPCFPEIAPHLDILIHDESPLEERASLLIPKRCRRLHRSWVANLAPFAVPFHQQPEERILFLGSQLGLTEHRKQQIEYLRKRYGSRFIAIHDHSVAVRDMGSLNRFKVGFCPEGRKFGTPAMSASHTDRPFWSGCLGMVPVAEDSASGGRLDSLAQSGLIIRYPHGDLDALGSACDQALALPQETRKRIYDHFNRQETIGTVIASAIAAFQQEAKA